MPFGSADRELLRQIGHQLGQLTADLAALKQQVADQQHAIDQIRQDATAAITTGLAEIRAVARDGLARTNEIATGPLANIGNELVAIRGNITQLGTHIQQAAKPALPEPESEPADREPHAAPVRTPQPPPLREMRAADDPAVLQAAAGISAATLQAHRDTWEFLVKHAGQDQHFHLPAASTTSDGAIEVAVSGPTLVAALTRLTVVGDLADDPGTRAIAQHLHARLTETVEEIVTRPHRGDGAEPVRIVIDDRAGPEERQP
ncbi:hypothetical protein M2164_005902 [Streptomyces sp. SAI-208]|uniref:hypothetical protein n=1 Tax=Streptomyces sp. SAI-208 TaxID=2940550 RepID=UPI002475FB6E|nr:hypothetical protein [Streptomyces sp. SAI-208]MDH6610267.1 hypothetical protein [Streptomyces sp. SAI-208]